MHFVSLIGRCILFIVYTCKGLFTLRKSRSGGEEDQIIKDKHQRQECIPVGCVPPAAVAVSPAMHAPPHTNPLAMHTCPPAMHTPNHACLRPCMPPTMHGPDHADPHAYPLPHMPSAMQAPCHVCLLYGQTDTYENITFTNFVCGGKIFYAFRFRFCVCFCFV